MSKLTREQRRKVAKPLLYVSMASILMLFAGLTSGYLVRMAGTDWNRIPFPSSLFLSTLLIFSSSVVLQLAYGLLKKGRYQASGSLAALALILGLGFMYAQFNAFGQLIADGVYFTGANSNIAGSFMYVLIMVHLAHVVAGVITLTWISIKTLRHRYERENTLGFQLGLLFWHFLGLLWLFLFLFLYFVR